MPYDLSVVIPVYNRGDLIRHTLESVRRASAGLAVETIVVDDGSETPVGLSLARLGFEPARLIRQENKGLLAARLAGLAAATARCALFLDSDDLVGPGKFRAQLAAMDATGADVSYTDTARCVLDRAEGPSEAACDAPCAETSDPAELYIGIQPPPHGPIFRLDYLRRVVEGALFPPSPLYNPVAEIWFYYNAAPRPARIVKAPGAHTIVGIHGGVRLTSHWERLGAASLAVVEAFARHCPETPETAPARQAAAVAAFRSWRRLPRGFSREFGGRLLAAWSRLGGGGNPERLGGPHFRALARLLGPVGAGRLLRLLQNGPYDRCRTLSDREVRDLLAALPSP